MTVDEASKVKIGDVVYVGAEKVPARVITKSGSPDKGTYFYFDHVVHSGDARGRVANCSVCTTEKPKAKRTRKARVTVQAVGA